MKPDSMIWTKHEAPDMANLNDWALIYAPESYAAAKYLTDANAFYDVLYAAWSAAGMPEIEEPFMA